MTAPTKSEEVMPRFVDSSSVPPKVDPAAWEGVSLSIGNGPWITGPAPTTPPTRS